MFACIHSSNLFLMGHLLLCSLMSVSSLFRDGLHFCSNTSSSFRIMHVTANNGTSTSTACCTPSILPSQALSTKRAALASFPGFPYKQSFLRLSLQTELSQTLPTNRAFSGSPYKQSFLRLSLQTELSQTLPTNRAALAHSQAPS